MPTHYRTCNLCEAMCGLEIQYEGTTVQTIKGDKNDPLSRGHICPKAVGLKDIYEDPDRLKQPVRRRENGWEVISWEEAYTEVVENIQRIQHQHGKNAVGAYLGNPNAHNVGSILFGRNLLKTLASQNIFSATSADQLPHHYVSTLLFGHMMAIPIPDIDRTDFFLIIGGNPMVSNGSLMTAPDFPKRLRAIQKRGGKVVVIDPRRTETADKADQYIGIKPGHDVLLLLGMLHHLIEKEQVNLRHLEPLIVNLDTIKEIVAPYSSERVATPLGIKASKIRELATEFCSAKSAVCYGRLGVSTQQFGGLCQWLIYLLNMLSGNLDRAGGAMFTQPAFDVMGLGKSTRLNRWKSRVRGLPEFGGELPCVTMAEEMLTEGEGQIKAMFTVAGNPVLSTANGKQLEQAFEQLDFMVSIDIYINETTKFANIILPPATGLETGQYDVIFHQLAIRNTAKYSPPLFEKSDDQRYDWEILQTLAQRLKGEEASLMSPEMVLDFTLQSSPYQLSLAQLKEQPHGVDLGAMNPCLENRLKTKEKTINLAPNELVADLKRVEQSFFNASSPSEYPLYLISRRQLRSNNSWMHNSYRLVKGPKRCTVLIHPNDAKNHQIEHGQAVNVISSKGQIQLPAEVSDEMLEGVVCIPHGWGHAREGVQLQVAKAHAGTSINDLTDEYLIDELTGNTAFSGVRVQLEAISQS